MHLTNQSHDRRYAQTSDQTGVKRSYEILRPLDEYKEDECKKRIYKYGMTDRFPNYLQNKRYDTYADSYNKLRRLSLLSDLIKDTRQKKIIVDRASTSKSASRTTPLKRTKSNKHKKVRYYKIYFNKN